MLAADGSVGGLDVPALISNYGFPTTVLILLLAGVLVTGRELKQTRADLETERSARIALQSTLISDVVPAITSSTDAIARATRVMEAQSERAIRGGE